MARKSKGNIVDMALFQAMLDKAVEKKVEDLVRGSTGAKAPVSNEPDIKLTINGKTHKAHFVTGTKNKKGRVLKATRVTFTGVEGALYFR